MGEKRVEEKQAEIVERQKQNPQAKKENPASDLRHPASDFEQMTLSLCMIAKNESGNIGRCLQSARNFVDEIIVVDTGSTDDTVDIARDVGATVIETEWQEDFSLARNASLDRATGDWILFLDCDEELAPGSGPDLRELIRDSRYEAYFIQVSNLTETGSKLLVPSVRLFRNRKAFRFEGRIHEQIATSIIANNGQQSIGQCSISIIHHGYNGQQSNIQAKIKRNLKLLGITADKEKDGFFYYNLGVEHLRLREMEKALDCFLKAAKLTAANLGYAPILALRTATTLMDLSRYRDAVRHLKYYQGIYGNFNDLFLLEMLCYLHCGWYSQASECLQRYFAMPPAHAWFPTETNYCGASAEEFRNWLQGRPIPKDYPGISACIIGRDEADHIRHCIHSINEIAREVIYVDTGSTDDAPAIAFQHGAKVFPITWTGNFAEARNYALDQASAEWILVLDADEVLPEESKKQTVDVLKKAPPDEGGYILKICTFLDGSISPANCHITGSCRLFRRGARQGGHGPVARYRGVAGEEVATSLQASGQTVAPAEITVNHLHYQSEPKSIDRKRQWKIDAINQGLQEDRLTCNYLLGTELFYARDFAAASDRFAACRKLTDMSGTPDFFYYYALSLINTRDYNCAAGILDEALGLFPDYTDLTYLLAVAHSALGNTEAAETLLRRCLELGDAPWQKYLVSPGTGSFKAMHSLGTVLAQRGLFAEAADLLFQATALPGGFEQAIEGIVVLSDKLDVPLEQILEEKGLLNPVSISAAAKTCAKMLRFQDSLRYLDMACDEVVRGPAPRNFTCIVQAIDLLIKMFCRGPAPGAD
jgi:glycosyltransferase involved in cell wall biosynthesis